MIVSEARDTLGKRKLIDEADILWKGRDTISLLAQDRYLFDEQNKPNSKHSADELRNWIKTRTLAGEVVQETISRNNSTLLTWLTSGN